MGIGITSNLHEFMGGEWSSGVSIPNGDRHYLEPNLDALDLSRNRLVSIPNGDRHYLEREIPPEIGQLTDLFQSPMGIGITSNGGMWVWVKRRLCSFNPQWG